MVIITGARALFFQNKNSCDHISSSKYMAFPWSNHQTKQRYYSRNIYNYMIKVFPFFPTIKTYHFPLALIKSGHQLKQVIDQYNNYGKFN